jgi:hypothetical protein
VAYCAGLAVRKFEDVTDLGANAVRALYAGLEGVAPFAWLAPAKDGLKEDGVGFVDGGGRGGSDEGCGLEAVWRPGGGGRDMMNGCPV